MTKQHFHSIIILHSNCFHLLMIVLNTIIAINHTAMSHLKSVIAKYSRYGLIAMGIYLAIVIFYSIRAASCDTSALDCSRPLFLLSLPLYLIVSAFVHTFSSAVYAILIFISSTFYAASFYEAGKWIEQWRSKAKPA